MNLDRDLKNKAIDSYWTRVFIVVVCFLFLSCNGLSRFGEMPKIFMTPTGIFRWLPEPHLGGVFRYLFYVWLNSLVLMVLPNRGLRRLGSALAFGLGIWILGYPNNFGTNDHPYNLFALSLFVFFLEDFFPQKSFRFLSHSQWAQRWELTPWPLFFIRFMCCYFYFDAGIEKLRLSGWSWATGLSMRNILLIDEQPWGEWIAGYPWICTFFGVSALALELLSPLALVTVRTRLWWIFPALWTLMHFLIFLFMKPMYIVQVANLAVWVPWHRYLPRLSKFRIPLFPIPKKRRIIPDLAFLAVAGLFTWNVWTSNADTWPLGIFDMYSKPYTGNFYHKSFVWLFDEKGERIPLVHEMIWPFKNDRLAVILVRAHDEPGQPRLEEAMKETFHLLRRRTEAGRRVHKIKVMYMRWYDLANFDLNQPALLHTLIERNVSDYSLFLGGPVN